MASSSDWLHFHQSSASAPGHVATPYSATSASDLFYSGRASDPAVVSTTMGPINDPAHTGPAQLGPNPNRVSKPARKRTRASRRTPTTLLNTDTTNFRAMVQQFTGGPSSNFDIPGPSPQMYGNGLGGGYGLQLPVGQLQQQVLGSLQYSNNNNNNNNNIMLMQRLAENNHPSFTTSDHHGSNNNNNINVNMSLSGTGGGSLASDNRSIDNFHF
ncbi:VQ motif-containing protein 22 [Bienertia sinuspersici]